jgi:glycolate oxidase iron-sulfur subunit
MRKVLMLAGCVQPSMMPNVTRNARVLTPPSRRAGRLQPAGKVAGAVPPGTTAQGGPDRQRAQRRCVVAFVERGVVEAIVMNAPPIAARVTVRESTDTICSTMRLC